MNSVGDVMIDIGEYPTINENEPVNIAFGNLKDMQVLPWVGNKTIVVTNNEGNAVGLLTLRSLLKAIDLDDPMMEMEMQGEYWSSYFAWHKKNWATLPVSKVMCPLTNGIPADTSIRAAVREMIQKNANSLPVMDGGKVVGLINVYYLCEFFADYI